MSGNTKALRTRIKSVTSTMQLTKAMGLVASSKIRKANEAMQKSRDYCKALEDTIAILAADREIIRSPYMQMHDTGRTKIIIIAGDRGLAGGYNTNVFRLGSTHPDAEFIPIGKRACEKYNKAINSSDNFSFEEAFELADIICNDFAEGKFDKLGIISTKYHSVMSQEAYIRWILPFEKNEDADVTGIVFEPDNLTILNNVAREYVAGMITVCARESFASEVAARRTAMDSAEKNAQQMISDLRLEYNRARQGAITQEITEIIAGSGI